jgi:hypothetical protein
MEAPGGRGGIAPTHSQPRHYMGVSGQIMPVLLVYKNYKCISYHAMYGCETWSLTLREEHRLRKELKYIGYLDSVE